MRRKHLSTAALVEGIQSGNRVILSQAITLVESRKPEDQDQADEVLEAVLADTGKSLRLGITGVPGVGKSTFIEAFGQLLIEKGKKVAVLSIDPTSQRSRGSILGDKTRMEFLSRHPSAFVRPTPSGQTLGGVGSKTRETMLLCEAAGYDVVIIETVGVGQSETLVHGMVDFFLLLMLAGAGDELQGIKKGIMEMADAVVINKADGDNRKAAQRAKTEYKNALHLFPPNPSGWMPEVLTCSSLQPMGLDDIWEMLERHQEKLKANGHFEAHRKQQQVQWFESSFNDLLKSYFFHQPEFKAQYEKQLALVAEGKLPVRQAAKALIQRLGKD